LARPGKALEQEGVDRHQDHAGKQLGQRRCFRMAVDRGYHQPDAGRREHQTKRDKRNAGDRKAIVFVHEESP
jgi:hypothetical protein